MKLCRKLRAVFGKEKLDAEMAEEMRLHLERRVEENIAAGMSAEEARYAAQREFGGVEQVKEIAREQRGWAWLESRVRDFRYAARALRKAPGYTSAVVVTLAIGVGLVTAIVDVSVPILWPKLPFPEADRVVMLRVQQTQSKGYAGLPTTFFAAFSEHASALQNIGADNLETVNLVVAGEPSPVRVSNVTEGFFPALGVKCVLGRLFAPEDHLAANAGEAVVLSHAAWTRYFGRDPQIVGREVTLGGRIRRMIGVLAPGFRSLPDSAVSASDVDGIYVAAAPFQVRTDSLRYVRAIARLKPGVTLAAAQAQLRTIKPEATGSVAQYSKTLEPVLTSMPDLFRATRAQPFRMFLGAAAALYLIGGTTVANLMLSRVAGRRREIGVRLALGGSEGRIMSLIMSEALVLGLLGAGAGGLLAAWAKNLLAHLTPAGSGIEMIGGSGLSWETRGLALALGVATCAFAAWILSRTSDRTKLYEALKEGSGTQGESPRLRWLRGTFVVAQSALAVTLLIGAGLMLHTVGRLQAIELGFDPTQKLLILGSRPAATIDRSRIDALNAEIVARVAALPGVEQAMQVGSAPLAQSVSLNGFTVEGAVAAEPSYAYTFAVAPNYFETMGIRFVAGGVFSGPGQSDRAVAVINETIARERFPNENPVGRALVLNKQRVEIVGVVRDVAMGYRGRGDAIGPGGKPITAQIYSPMPKTQADGPGLVNIVVKFAANSGAGTMAAIQRAVTSADPTVIVTSLRSLEDVVSGWSSTERHALLMLQILSGLALGLAAFGTFSVMAYSVGQRRAEFGLRLVLGATPAQLTRFVIRRGLVLGAIGIVLGLGLAAALGRFLQAVLYQTSALEPEVFAGVALLLLIVTAAACWLPARRASKVDPMVALRAE